MKNSYELAADILEMNTENNTKNKTETPSDTFTSIDLYGDSVHEHGGDDGVCSRFHLENESGTGDITMLTGCGDDKAATESTTASTTEATEVTTEAIEATTEATEVTTEAESEEETEAAAEDNKAVAEQLLKSLTGTYQELWPVILADEYQQIWQ